MPGTSGRRRTRDAGARERPRGRWPPPTAPSGRNRHAASDLSTRAHAPRSADDPRDGVVLGMLHSSKNAAPIDAKDTNHEKGFTTRSKMHIAFDDEKKRISIDTPAKNSIVIDESAKSIVITDQNNNKIEMTPSGIEMKSPKNITVDAGMVLTLKGGQSVEMSAPQIAIKADASVEIKGAMAKMAASGIAEVSGSLVKIN